jgi:hypothetical protein
MLAFVDLDVLSVCGLSLKIVSIYVVNGGHNSQDSRVCPTPASGAKLEMKVLFPTPVTPMRARTMSLGLKMVGKVSKFSTRSPSKQTKTANIHPISHWGPCLISCSDCSCTDDRNVASK